MVHMNGHLPPSVSLSSSLSLSLSQRRPIGIEPNSEVSFILSRFINLSDESRDYNFFYLIEKDVCRGKDLASGKHQYTMLKWDDGPSVLNNPDHKLTGKGELLRFKHQGIIF